MTRVRLSPLTSALLALTVAAFYGRTLTFGLIWDDFAALRPRPLAAAWHGPWDPGGVWPDFYRPLSIALYDALFRLLGHQAVALHLVTLLLLFAAAWLFGSIVAEECDDARCGAVAALLFVTHPRSEEHTSELQSH